MGEPRLCGMPSIFRGIAELDSGIAAPNGGIDNRLVGFERRWAGQVAGISERRPELLHRSDVGAG